MADGFSVDLNAMIQKIKFEPDGVSVKKLTNTLKQIASGKDLQKYWTTSEDAIRNTTNALENFKRKQTKLSADKLIKTANALKSITGSTKLADVLPDKEIDVFLEKAKNLRPAIAKAFSTDVFADAFVCFKQLEKESIELTSVFDKLSKYSSLWNKNLTLNSKNSKLKSIVSDSDIKNIQDMQRQLRLFKSEAEATFRTFLQMNNISLDGDNIYGDYDSNRFSSYFKAIQNGSMTASQAITEVKRDYEHLLKNASSAKTGDFGTENLNQFVQKLNEIFVKVESIYSQLTDIISNGVLTKAGENLDKNFSLGKIDETSFQSLKALLESVLSEINANKNVSLFDKSELRQVVETLSSIESSLSSLRSIISDVGDGQELSPLLSSIKQINDSLLNLSESARNVGLNMNINAGASNGEETYRKLQEKQSKALIAYQELFNEIKNKASSFTGQYDFFSFDINQFDSITNKIDGYRKFIANARESVKKINGSDLLFEYTDPSYWRKASAAYGQITSEINKITKGSNVSTNSITNLFEKTDLSGVVNQLTEISSKLSEISNSAKLFSEQLKQSLDISSSVQQIIELTGKVKELELELASVKNSTKFSTNTSSSENQNKIQQELKETESTTKQASKAQTDFAQSNATTKQSVDETTIALHKNKAALEALIADWNKNKLSGLNSQFYLTREYVDPEVSQEVNSLTRELNKLAEQVLRTNAESAWEGIIAKTERLRDILSTHGQMSNPDVYQDLIYMVDYFNGSNFKIPSNYVNEVLSSLDFSGIEILGKSGSVENLRDLNKQLIQLGVTFSRGKTGDLNGLWEEICSDLGRHDWLSESNEINQYITLINELLSARSKMYGERNLEPVNDSFVTSTIVDWLTNLETYSHKAMALSEEQEQINSKLTTATTTANTSAEQSQKPLHDEAVAMKEVSKEATQASEAKNKFAEANKRVKEGANQSATTLSEEATGLNKVSEGVSGFNQNIQQAVQSEQKIGTTAEQTTTALQRENTELEEQLKVLSQVGELYVDSTVRQTLKKNDGQLIARTYRQKTELTESGEIQPVFDADGNIVYAESQDTIISNFEKLEKTIIDADNALRKMNDTKREVQKLDSKATTTSIDKQIADQKEYISLLESTIKVISDLKVATTDVSGQTIWKNVYDIDPKAIQSAREKAEREYNLNRDSKQETTQAKQSAKNAEKEASNIRQVNKLLNDKEIKLERIKKSYEQGTSPDKYVKDKEDLTKLGEEYDKIQKKINALKNTQRNKSNEQEFLELDKLISNYEVLAKAKLKANNPTKAQLSGEDLEVLLEDQISSYKILIAESEKYGEKTSEITQKLKEQLKLLETAKAKGNNAFKADDYYTSRDTYRKESSKLKATKSDTTKSQIENSKELSEIYDNTVKKLLELENQYKSGKISAEKYGKSVKELINSYKDLTSIAKYVGYESTDKNTNSILAERKKLYKEIGNIRLKLAKVKDTDGEDYVSGLKTQLRILKQKQSLLTHFIELFVSEEAVVALNNELAQERLSIETKIAQAKQNASNLSTDSSKENKTAQTTLDKYKSLLKVFKELRNSTGFIRESGNISDTLSKGFSNRNNPSELRTIVTELEAILKRVKDINSEVKSETAKTKNTINSLLADGKISNHYNEEVERIKQKVAEFNEAHKKGTLTTEAYNKQIQSLIQTLKAYKRIVKYETVLENTETKEAAMLEFSRYATKQGIMKTPVTMSTMDANGVRTMTTTIITQQGELQKLVGKWSSTAAAIGITEKSMGRAESAFNRITSSLGNKWKQLFSYMSAMYLNPYTLIYRLKDVVTTISELDDEIMDLRKTAQMTTAQLNEFYLTSNDVAKEMGVTTQEILSQASAWSRLGYSTASASTEMAKLSSQFATISPGMDVDEATTGLVSVMKAFDISTDSVKTEIMDKINVIGNNFATNNQEIITGLQKMSSAMASTGADLEETIALFTAGQEVVQDAEQVGSAIKSFSMRIRGMEEEGEYLDELKNIQGDVYELTNGKVHIMEDEDTYRPVLDILRDISECWDDITDKNRAKLLEKLFAKTRANVGAAVLQNFEQAEKSLQVMENSYGSSDDEMQIAQDTISYKINELKETWTGFFQDIAARDDVKDIVVALTNVSETISNIISNLGLFRTALSGVLTFFAAKLKVGRENYISNLLSKCRLCSANYTYYEIHDSK